MVVENYQVQKATPKHCKEIVAIAKDGQVFNYWFFYAVLVRLGWVLVMLDKEGAVAGYTCFAPLPFSNTAVTIQAALKPEHRNKGLGSSLLGYTCAYLRRFYAANKVYAHTLKPRVFRLLKRMGWEAVGDVFGIFAVRKDLTSISDKLPVWTAERPPGSE